MSSLQSQVPDVKNNPRPQVSIGLPVYNGAKFIRDALDSILAQTFHDFELIISDNGSTDDTPAICQEYARKDPRIRYYGHDKNMGATWNHNRTFNLARGEYFKWQHYDDLLDPTYVERCMEQLKLHPEAVLCFSGTVIMDENKEKCGEYYDHLDLRSPVPHIRWRQALDHDKQRHAFFGVMHRDKLAETGLFGNFQVPERILMAEMSLRGQFIEIHELLFYRREHGDVAWAKNKNSDDFSKWLNPSTKSNLIMPRWRRLLELFKAIPRAKLGWRESLFCYMELIQHGFSAHKWRGLGEDLARVARRVLQGLLKGSGGPNVNE